MSVIADGVRVVVAGGHSAGHIEPAMNFADALRAADPGAQITALGTERGLDTTLIPQRGYRLELIPPVPLPRRPGRALAATPGKLRAAVAAARAVLERTDAEVVVGFGGYVAMPAYIAARQHRVPIVIHEANARPGVANRIGARMTRHVFTAVGGTRLPHARVIGIPLRPAIVTLDRAAQHEQACAHFGLDPRSPVLLVTGGSQGARAINHAVARAAEQLRGAGVQLLHIVGPKNLADTEATAAAAAVRARSGATEDPAAAYVLTGYVDRMDLAYAAADFVLCRSGAMTCAELSAVGLPAAYVPLPLRGGEQRHNADAVVAAGGGIMVDNDELDAAWLLAEVLPRITDPATLQRMGLAAARQGSRDAAATLAAHVRTVVGEYRYRRGEPGTGAGRGGADRDR